MKYKKLIVLAGVLLVVVFAGSKIISPSESDNGHGDSHDDHGQAKSSQVTVWDDRFEIFMEHPFVVANKPTKFVTHVTDRMTLKPRRKGSVTFVLTDNDGVSKRHVEKTPARDGIYIPGLTFPHFGIWNVSLEIGVEGKAYVVKLPAIKVYKSQAEADLAPSPDEVAGISFLKEQQWELPFATEVVQQKNIHSQAVPAVPQSAIVDENGKPVAFVQLTGEMFEKRYLKLGNKDQGSVQVLSGLSEGEYVATKGAYAVARAEHGKDSFVQFSEEDARRFGIEVANAGGGEFMVHLSVPGEIVINSDRMAHIVPVVPGIVRKVSKKLGDRVKAGEVIAWLESSDLGKAKMDYLGKWGEMTCCALDLTRAQQINDNTLNLLTILADSPSLETLQNAGSIEMGDNLSKLISTYSEYSFAKAAYQREKPLFEQKISSEEDFLKAQNSFKKADAQYAATRDSISFEVKRNLLEANRARQLQSMELKNAERQLKILGLTDETIKELEMLAENQISAPAPEPDCDNPDCAECQLEKKDVNKNIAALKKAEEKLAWYPLVSPFDGSIISKHITLGEMVDGDSDVFVVADLDTVWVDLKVHQKDLRLISKGQEVIISSKSSISDTKGVIDYVDPVVDEKTRTALARMILDNRSRQLRPGTFITAKVTVQKRSAGLVVDKDVLQDVDDKVCVFVQNDHGFEARPVTIGRSNESKVEIVSGLRVGEIIVTKNSFRLKAELEKDAGGGHAGHGH
jgi:RND family efflux transporter MFP subunit